MIRVMIRDKNTGLVDCWSYASEWEAGVAILRRLKQDPKKGVGEWMDIHVMETQNDKET